MGISKAFASRGFNQFGGAVIRNAGVLGSGYAVNTSYNTPGVTPTRFDPTGYVAKGDYVAPTWGTTGIFVNQTGTLIFSKYINGGALEEITLINRGPDNCYVNFNSPTPGASGSLLLGTGVLLQYYDQKIGYIAVASVSAVGTTITAQGGFFSY
jgi:hypothetical protein